ncbi:MAG TPA: hypothetical protein VLM05_09765 [Mycobacteriales bacterium]|nr:hypothetical protein [Mycobacteriales bacterium]
MSGSQVLSRRAGRRPDHTVWVALALVVGFVLVRLVVATPLAGFPVASDDFVDPARTPDALVITTDSGGYDGQFIYRLALEPWTHERTAHGITLDNPAYRQQRIVTPGLAWTVGLLPGVSTLLALLLVNLAALVVAAVFAARLARALGRHPLTGLVLALPAGMPISLGRNLTEPVAWAAVLAGLWYARQRRWPPAAAALTVAVLARETSLVVVAGLAAAELIRWAASRGDAGRPGGDPGRDGGAAGPGRAVVWLALPVTVAVAWQLVLLRIWGVLPVRSGSSTNFGGRPLLGVLGTVADGVPGPAVLTVAVTAERIGVLVLFGYAAWALVTRRAAATGGEAVAWVLAVALSLAVGGWTSDVQFLRAANEAIGLSVLVALSDRRSRSGRWALPLAAAIACGVALEYAVRQ